MSEAIEAKEQNLVQRIRTSGLPQSRELLLVDEVLEVRKLRRQLFRGQQDIIEQLQSATKSFEETILKLESNGNAYQLEMKGQLQEMERIKNEEIAEVKKKLTSQLASETQQLLDAHRKELKATKRQYESRLLEVAGRLEEVIAEKERHDLVQAKSIAAQLVKKVSEDLEAQYQRKAVELKESVVQLADREEIAQKMLKDAQQREKSLLASLESLQSRSEVAFMREKELEKRCLLQAQELDAVRSELQLRSDSLQQERVTHEAALKEVDDKVRRVLEARDGEIRQLREEVQTLRKEKYALEKVFKDLNRDLR